MFSFESFPFLLISILMRHFVYRLLGELWLDKLMKLTSQRLQDMDLSFKYVPEQQWNSSPVNAGMCSGGSGQYLLYFLD